jgi:S1-C subfamily serine protease
MLACATATVALADDVVDRIVDRYAKVRPGTTAALGISRMECRCSFTIGDDPEEKFWSFESEPLIQGVDPRGPARGKLERGDTIVAIDRMLITTHEAGKRFANVEAGEPVELTVRRRGRLIDVRVVAAASDEASTATIDSIGESLSDELVELRLALGQLSELGVELGSLHGTLGIVGLDDLDFQPTGWFGFGLSFAGSIHRSSEGGRTHWSFDESPKVQSVSAGGPAERAGLRRGDLLTHIDGVRLDTKKGGRLFSEVLPGQGVEFEIRRSGSSRTVRLVAEERPDPETDE